MWPCAAETTVESRWTDQSKMRSGGPGRRQACPWRRGVGDRARHPGRRNDGRDPRSVRARGCRHDGHPGRRQRHRGLAERASLASAMPEWPA